MSLNLGQMQRGFGRSGFRAMHSMALNGPLLSGGRLGQTNQEWFNRAKVAVTAYEDLQEIVPRIVDLRKQADIIDWMGSVFKTDSPEYRWNTVKSDLEQAETEGIGIYSIERRTNRIVKLEDFVKELREQIGDAGLLAAKAAPTPEPGVLVTPVPPKETTIVIEPPEDADIATPIGIGLGAVALAILASSVL